MTAAPPSGSSAPLAWPEGEPALLPFLPMIYVAWADGALDGGEIANVRHTLEGVEGLDPHCRDVVCRWLNPDAPPASRDLQHLLTVIRREASGLAPAERRSLAELGKALATRPPDGATTVALEALENALGVVGTEASRELVAPRGDRIDIEREPPPGFAVADMTAILDGRYAEVRNRVRAVLRDPAFRYRPDLDRDAYRELVLAWCRRLATEGFGSLGVAPQFGGGGDLGAFIAAFETLAFHDFSLVVKFGVQFGLFGGSVYFLGTRRHHERYLPDIGTLDLPGCFAMSELGHGSNVWDLETAARYDPATGEFEIHTPSESARKEWIGNAAMHGRVATVFAQLEVAGEPYGVHAFLVPIRDEDGRPCEGVRIEDCGAKEGLNGVDNGRLWFDRVRIPRDHLLNRYGDVNEEGIYTSPINSASKRFFTMLGTLVAGRVSVAAAALSAAKSGLTIAIRYGVRRRQFGAAGQPETPILDYRSHQLRLFPRLATVYALDAALEYLTGRYLTRTPNDSREVEALAAGLKAYTTWNTVHTLQECREACGGQGYLSANRLPDLKADTDVFTTFEGDNVVLMQLVAKSLLTDYRDQFGDLRLWSVVKYLAERAAKAVSQMNPIVTRNTEETHLRDPEFHLGVFRYREERLKQSVARRLKALIDGGVDSFTAINTCQDHLLRVAQAYVERVVVECTQRRVDAVATSAVGEPLATLRDLYALSRLHRDRGWFLETGVFEGGKARAIRALVARLCGELRDHAVPLVDSFGIPDECLAAPIAFDQKPAGPAPAGA